MEFCYEMGFYIPKQPLESSYKMGDFFGIVLEEEKTLFSYQEIQYLLTFHLYLSCNMHDDAYGICKHYPVKTQTSLYPHSLRSELKVIAHILYVLKKSICKKKILTQHAYRGSGKLQ